MVPPRTRAPLGAALLLAAACFNPTGSDPTASGSSSSGGPGSSTGAPTTDTPATTSGDASSTTSPSGSITASSDPTAVSTSDATATTTTDSTSDASSTGQTTVGQTSGQMAPCGDGIAVVGLEECDDQNMDPSDGCDNCKRTRYLVFTTKDAYDGTFGGLKEADQVCQGEAQAAGLQGLFRAWLSTDGESVNTRLSRSNGAPYVRTDGALIADNWNALIANGPAVPIDRDATNTPLLPGMACVGDRVWTGTENTGEPVTKQHCEDWTQDLNATGAVGSYTTSGVAPAWTHCNTHGCALLARLYCFEQPLP